MNRVGDTKYTIMCTMHHDQNKAQLLTKCNERINILERVWCIPCGVPFVAANRKWLSYVHCQQGVELGHCGGHTTCARQIHVFSLLAHHWVST